MSYGRCRIARQDGVRQLGALGAGHACHRVASNLNSFAPNCPRKNALPRHSLRGKGGSSTVLRNFHHIWLPAADFSALINLGKMLKVGRAARSLLGRWIGYTATSRILAHFQPLKFRSITQRVKENTRKKRCRRWSHYREQHAVTLTQIETLTRLLVQVVRLWLFGQGILGAGSGDERDLRVSKNNSH